MTGMLRLVDSGLRHPRENLSLTEALCRRHKAGLSPDTFRFQHFPPSAIVGRHQLLQREVNLPYVAQHGLATARRMTGGGAIVMGPGILGWELILSRRLLPPSLAEVSRLLCEAVASGLSTLGVEAAYRPRNDIEVGGRKVSGTGGYFDGDTLVFQGTVLMALDIDLMTGALNLPAHKLGKRGLDTFRERVVDLRELLDAPPPVEVVERALGEAVAVALGCRPTLGLLDADEESLARAVHEAEIGREAFVRGLDDAFASDAPLINATHPTPAGTIDIAILPRTGAAGIVDQVMITGDFFAAHPRVVADLEAHLRQQPLDTLAAEAAAFLATHDAGFLGIGAADIVEALTLAAAREPA